MCCLLPAQGLSGRHPGKSREGKNLMDGMDGMSWDEANFWSHPGFVSNNQG